MTEHSGARVLLDSNILIHILAGDHPEALSRLTAMDKGQAVTSVIAYAEVTSGAARGTATLREKAAALFREVPPQPFDARAALFYAALPFRRGRFDRLIAAHALALGLTVITNNPRDYADVPGLRVENWIA